MVDLHLRLAVFQIGRNRARNLSDDIRLVVLLLLDPLQFAGPDDLARSLRNDALLARSTGRRGLWLLLQESGRVLGELLRICAYREMEGDRERVSEWCGFVYVIADDAHNTTSVSYFNASTDKR